MLQHSGISYIQIYGVAVHRPLFCFIIYCTTDKFNKNRSTNSLQYTHQQLQLMFSLIFYLLNNHYRRHHYYHSQCPTTEDICWIVDAQVNAAEADANP